MSRWTNYPKDEQLTCRHEDVRLDIVATAYGVKYASFDPKPTESRLDKVTCTTCLLVLWQRDTPTESR